MYIVRFYHRHGNDVWPVWRDKAPTEEEVIEELKNLGQWDGGDEYIEIYGPFKIPEGAK